MPMRSIAVLLLTAHAESAQIHVINTSFVALRFHKVASTTFKTVLSDSVSPAYMEHESLAAYRSSGLTGLRCLGAPATPRVVFIALLREPVSRILSAVHFYARFGTASVFLPGGVKGSGPTIDYRARAKAAQEWLYKTPCSGFTSAGVAGALEALSHVQIGETLGAGMIAAEYSHYFRVRTAADIPPALARLRREFVVGLTEDMHSLIDVLARFVPPPQRAALAEHMKAALARKRATPKLEARTPDGRLSRAANGMGEQLRRNYCGREDVPRSVLGGLARLAGHDVAFYAGAKAIHDEQKHQRDGALLPLSEFAKMFKGTSECRRAIPSSAVVQDDTVLPMTRQPPGGRHGGSRTTTILLFVGLPLAGFAVCVAVVLMGVLMVRERRVATI